jgi:Zn-dependent protease/CBS domain-containing protein
VNPSLPLGRIAGIRVGLNWSLAIVFALIVWTLADGVFPRTDPGLSSGAYVAMAVVAAVLFLASIVLHELGHALRARREGVEIDGITLWLFGGVAQLRGLVRSPGAEFRIAIAGPAVSAALGGLFVLLAYLLGGPPEVDGVSAWLGYINLSLLVFNLLPALPLDGGRVLRSALWRLRGDFAWATEVSARISRGIAYVLIVAGVALFIFQGSFSGAWLAFIGWFLLQAASAEVSYLAAQGALGGLRVRDLMVREPVAVEPELSIGRFMDEVVRPHRHSTYPVVRDGRVLGLLSFPSVIELPRAEWDRRRVGERMLARERVPVFVEDASALDALAALAASGSNRALVVDGERLVGLLSLSDLARALPRRRSPARGRPMGLEARRPRAVGR